MDTEKKEGQLSRGRFILGIGVGWARQEFAALGVPFARRGAITDEYLTAIRATWAEEIATYHGAYVSFDKVATGSPPVKQPHPPIWVGGNGHAAWRRSVRFDATWHPIGIRIRWLRDVGLPGLCAVAQAAGRPVPALCPRIRLPLAEAALDDGARLAGEGSLSQIRADLEALETFGAEYVVLDPYRGNPAATRDHERSWAMLATLAEHVLDLEHARLR